jgi:hypothetical protein
MKQKAHAKTAKPQGRPARSHPPGTNWTIMTHTGKE